MPKSVLVADDSATMRKIIGMVFSTEDFQLTVVDNGLDAIAKARDGRPDVVLLDCMMPGKSGYEACEAIKGDPSTQHIPVMLLSGNFEPYDEGRARAAGANEHIVKPFDSQAFIDKVKRLVGMPTTAAPVMTYKPVSTGPIEPPAGVPPRTSPGMPNPMMGQPGQPRPMPGPAGIPAGMPRPMGAPGVPMGTQPGIPRPPGVPMGTQPGIPRPPMGGPGVPMGTQPGVMRPPMPGMGHPGMPMGGQPGMPMRPMTPGPGMPQMARPPPGGVPPGTQPGFPRPPPGAPLPGVPQRRDPFGLGGAPQPPPGRPPPAAHPPPAPQPMHREQLDLEASIAKDGGEAQLREALSKASREVIEKIAWEVVPQLAETIIREELDRLIKDRETKN